MIVDFRCRPAPLATLERSRIEHFQKVFDFRLTRSYREGSVELLLAEMDEAGVDKGVIIGRQNTKAGHLNNSNDDIARMVAQYPERFVGIGGIDTSDPQEAIRELERCVGELGMRGVSIEPNITRVPRYVDDGALYPFYQRCDELGLPVLITCVSGLGPYVDYTDPLRFDRIATDFPNLSFDMVHGGWPLVEQALAVAFKCPNVYIQPDQYLNYEMPGFERYVQAANTFLSDRLIFGSAYPACGLYRHQLRRIRRFPFKDTETLNKYLGGNALRLLNLAG